MAGWTVLNIVLAWGASGLMDGASIAWEAHLGGFYMGFLTFGLFDRSSAIHPAMMLRSRNDPLARRPQNCPLFILKSETTGAERNRRDGSG